MTSNAFKKKILSHTLTQAPSASQTSTQVVNEGLTNPPLLTEHAELAPICTKLYAQGKHGYSEYIWLRLSISFSFGYLLSFYDGLPW